MADTIGSLAYKLRLDSSQFIAGMVATRAEFAAARRIAGETTPAVDRYATSMSNLDVLLRKGLITAAQHSQMQDRVQREHLESESTLRRLTSAEYDRLKELRQMNVVVNSTAGDEARRNAILERGRQVTEQSRTSQQRMNRELAEARMLLREGAISAATYQRQVAQIRGPGPMAGLARTAGGMARGAAVGAATIGSTALIGSAIRTHAEIERLTAAMEAFTGSETKAAKVMADIRSLSSVAGISFDELAKGATTMLAYNVPLDQLMGKLTQMAGIARGDTERFDKLALAFGQVSGAGRLMAQEVLQMINAGFNPLQEIARTTGIDFLVLKKQMEEGKITVDMVSKAFTSATSAGGKFDGILDKIGKTSAGSLGRLAAEWNIFLDTLGKSMPVKEGSNALSKMLSGITTMFSEKPEAIKREMELAKKNATVNIDPQAHPVTKEMNALALKSNELDAKLKKFYEDNKRQAGMRDPRAGDEAKKKADADRLKQEQELRKNMADKLHELRMDSAKDLLPKDQNEKLKRTLDLLDDVTKKKAELDFLKNKDVDALSTKYLDKNTKNQLDALNREYAAMEADKKARKRGEAEQKQQFQLQQDANDVKARARMGAVGMDEKQMGFVDEVAKLKILLDKKLIDDKTFISERNRLARNMTDNLQIQSPQMATRGSQEAYKIITSALNRSDDKLLKENQRQSVILKTIEQTNKRAEELLKEMKDKLDFEVVG